MMVRYLKKTESDTPLPPCDDRQLQHLTDQIQALEEKLKNFNQHLLVQDQNNVLISLDKEKIEHVMPEATMPRIASQSRLSWIQWIKIIIVVMISCVILFLGLRFRSNTMQHDDDTMRYIQQRTTELMTLKQETENEIEDMRNKIHELITQSDAIPIAERKRLVPDSMNEKLDILINTKRQDLEKEMVKIKNSLGTLEHSIEEKILPDDKIVYHRLKSQLVSMEFNKLLISDESLALYEEGLIDLKAHITTFFKEHIQKQFSKEVDHNLLIENIFSSARLEAIYALLQHLYAPAHVLTPEAKKYNYLKIEINKSSLQIEKLFKVRDDIQKDMFQLPKNETIQKKL